MSDKGGYSVSDFDEWFFILNFFLNYCFGDADFLKSISDNFATFTSAVDC